MVQRQSAIDPFGLGRIAAILRQGRLDKQNQQLQEASRRIEEEEAITRGLNQQLLRGQLKRQSFDLADLVKKHEIEFGLNDILSRPTEPQPQDQQVPTVGGQLFGMGGGVEGANGLAGLNLGFKSGSTRTGSEGSKIKRNVVTTEFSGPTSRDRILGTKFKPAKSTKSKTQQAIEFLKVSDPTRAQKLITSVLENGRRVLKTSGAKAALDFVNSGLGKDWKLDSEDTETMTIDQGDKKVLINKATGEVVQEFPVTQKAKQLTPQQQAFSNLTPSEQKATFFKSGAEVELDKEGNFSLKLGGATKPQSEKERSAQEKRDLSARDAKINTDSVLEVLDSAIEGIGLTTTGFGSILKVVPGTAAGDLEGDLDTITANLAFKALADMRKASPTGGALGAISERELTLLGATIRSIKQKQSPEKLRENLNSIKTLFENAKQRIDVADSFRRQGIDPNNLTEEQLNTQQETGIKIVIPNHPQHGDVTEEDIEKTMQETGFTRDQVFKALGAQ